MDSDLIYLVRYGAVPEVARFRWDSAAPLPRGAAVVVESPRGLLPGAVLERDRGRAAETELRIIREWSPEDAAQRIRQDRRIEADFPRWSERIANWGLTLELIDLEWTLDDAKQILYVLTSRGPDATNLALHAAAEGLGVIEVQPVAAEGLIPLPSGGGGCGSGGCGCHH